jgi:beta-mannosidase
MKSKDCKIEYNSRRGFIKQSALVGGALLIPNPLFSIVLGSNIAIKSEGVLEKQVIMEGWKIKSISPLKTLSVNELLDATDASDNNEWLSVPSMPAMPHAILLQYKKIVDPVQPFGMEKCYWVSEKDWIYSVKFTAKKTKSVSRLIFEGVTGQVTVYLNNEKIASHNDKTVPLIADVTGYLQPNNTLVLHFEKAAPDQKPGDPNPSKRSSYSTYFGPNPMIYTSGIFDSVTLEYTGGSLMTEILTGFSVNESLNLGTVTIDVTGKSTFQKVRIRANLYGPNGEIKTQETIPSDVSNGHFTGQLSLHVSNPELWFPRGYGDQKLYEAEIILMVENKPHQKEYRTIGFRRIIMTELFHFEVNNVPVLLLGGNWIWPDLLSDVWNQEQHERLFELAENANFNVFRLNSSVPPETSRFYEMADQRGFLLWQEFPLPWRYDKKNIFGCVEKATVFLKTMKHHPSILLWGSANEEALWFHEDYNSDYTDHGPWPDLPSSEAVGEVCKKLDPDRIYQMSSPYFGMNPNDPRAGTTHGYTNLWFVPGYDYLNFATEDTRIAAPPLHSMKRFMKPEEIFPEGYSTITLPGNSYPYPKSWLPYTVQDSWKKLGPVDQLYDADDASSLVNRLGIAKAIYYQDTVERQRRGRPATEAGNRRSCGGYIVWKFNDSWPEIYSGNVDYFLEPYHAYYFLKRAYAPVLLSFDIDTFIYLWAINDSMETITGTVKIQLYHLELCQFRKEIIREIALTPGKSLVVVQLDKEGIRAFRKEHILFATLIDKSYKVIARTNAQTDIERRLVFPDAKLDIKITNNSLVITTDKFARNINLEGDANGDVFGWFFEDNYFDLLPGEVKTVRILGKHNTGKITAKPWYSPHVTKVDWVKL